jgi:predicted signal transduction protein with EAL and GGDEF domain
MRDPLTDSERALLETGSTRRCAGPDARASRSRSSSSTSTASRTSTTSVGTARRRDLATLARRFEAILRSSDTVARLGGDEFVVLSMETGSDDTAAALVGRLRHALRRPFRVDGTTIEIDGSIGWAVFPAHGSTSDELLSRADGQMYATKRDTSDDAVFVRRGVDAGIVRDVELALEQKELLVVYQPILDVATGAARRGADPPRAPGPGLASARRVRPPRQRTPLVRELTFLVVADALDSAQQWAKAGHNLGVAINIPYRLLDDPQFADGLAACSARG